MFSVNSITAGLNTGTVKRNKVGHLWPLTEKKTLLGCIGVIWTNQRIELISQQ